MTNEKLPSILIFSGVILSAVSFLVILILLSRLAQSGSAARPSDVLFNSENLEPAARKIRILVFSIFGINGLCLITILAVVSQNR